MTAVHGAGFLLTLGSLAAAVIALAGPASAQTAARATATVGGGASERGAVVPAPSSGRSATTFLRTEVGLDLAHRAPAAVQRLWYLAGATGYPEGGDANSLTQDLSWIGRWSSRRASLDLGASATHGLRPDVEPSEDTRPPEDRDASTPLPEDVAPDLWLPPAAVTGYAGGGVGEALAIEIGPRAIATQSAEGGLFSLMSSAHAAPPTLVFSHNLGLGRAWARDFGHVDLDAGYESAPERMEEGRILPAQQGQVARLSCGWGRQVAAGWSTDLTAGAFVARTSAAHPTVLGPAWRGTLRWRGRRFRARAIYDRSAYPDVVLGEIFLRDRVTVRTTGRFGHNERFRLSGLLRLQRIESLGAPDATRLHRLRARATFAARPWPRRDLEVAVSYRLTIQGGGARAGQLVRPFERAAVMLSVTAGWRLAGSPEEDSP